MADASDTSDRAETSDRSADNRSEDDQPEDDRSEDDELDGALIDDLEDGAGCVEIWTHLSEGRDEE